MTASKISKYSVDSSKGVFQFCINETQISSIMIHIEGFKTEMVQVMPFAY